MRRPRSSSQALDLTVLELLAGRCERISCSISCSTGAFGAALRQMLRARPNPPALPAPAGRVFLHPSSVNFSCGKFESGWLAYSEIVETSKVFVRESSMVPVYAVLLFGGEGPGEAGVCADVDSTNKELSLQVLKG